MLTCANCAQNNCRYRLLTQLPSNCPCLLTQRQEEIKALYQEPENHLLAYHSALTESGGYCRMSRMEETIRFIKRCGYQNIGLAFCVGLVREARIVSQILRENDLTVQSIICKNGSIPKEFIGITEEQKVRPGQEEAICNPIGQALLLNDAQTEFNIMLGLCVGHDSLFIKYSQAPVTVLAVKDRITGHNPLAAIYLHESYYKTKLHTPVDLDQLK